VPFSVTIDGEEPLRAPVTGGTFLNFCKDAARTHDAYTRADLQRLLELKHAYDPDNVFGVGHALISAHWRNTVVAIGA
jgi:hypothetical protein